MRTATDLTSQIVERCELGSAGASGNFLERVTLRDGRRLVLKRVSPEWDWLSRTTGDAGRIAWMWDHRLFDRMPASIDHATVAVETDGAAWSVFMTDVSGALVREGQRLTAAEVKRVLAATAELHHAFWGESFPELCGYEDRYSMLSLRAAAREKSLGNDLVGDGVPWYWEAFSENVPRDVADAILLLVDRPALLGEQLAQCAQTLIHGDVRLTNLGLSRDRVVLVDWGDRAGTAPPAVELASFLAFDGQQLDMPREEVIAEFRNLYGDRFEERALQLALIGGLVQLGANFGMRLVTDPDDGPRRALVLDDLAWWVRTVDTALETWSPV